MLLVLSSGIGRAAYVTQLDVANGGSATPPFATVTIEDSGDDAGLGSDIRITVDLIGDYASQDIEQFGFNVNGVAVGDLVFSGLGDWTADITPASMASFGTFDVTVNGGTGVDPLIFTIAVGGDSIATYTSALSSGGYLFAAKIAASGPGSFIGVVPVPAALPLFLSALAVFGFAARRRTA